jgi:hypothetical protein
VFVLPTHPAEIKQHENTASNAVITLVFIFILHLQLGKEPEHSTSKFRLFYFIGSYSRDFRLICPCGGKSGICP